MLSSKHLLLHASIPRQQPNHIAVGREHTKEGTGAAQQVARRKLKHMALPTCLCRPAREPRQGLASCCQ